MDAAEALADLTELSAQIRHAAIVDDGGGVVASTFADESRARRFGDLARRLAADAEAAGAARSLTPVAQLEAATLDGSVFLVRGDSRLIAATTDPEPTVGLVFYDLKQCLRAAEGADAAA
jgi:predicted regulator of Ras-like GTPase activity (Roadblock/LC7/MglB family)